MQRPRFVWHRKHELEDDPTLQPGDLIATKRGVVSVQTWRKANAYTPIDRKGVDNKLIIMTSERESVPVARPQRRAPLHKAAGAPPAMPASHQWW